MTNPTGSRKPVRGGMPKPSTDWALFFDVDGSLLDIAEHPDQVRVEPTLRQHLGAVYDALDGAVALISGRPLAQLDKLFAPLQLPAAGQHGLERRRADGRLAPAFRLPAGFDRAESRMQDLVARYPRLLLERKSHGLALHYRRSPKAGREVLAHAQDAARLTDPPLEIVQGKMVVELRTPGSHKGEAIAAFMAEPPFRGRYPVFVGDDITDEDGFAVVNAMGGCSVLVGERPTLARRRIASAAELRRWLAELPARLGRAPEAREEA